MVAAAMKGPVDFNPVEDSEVIRLASAPQVTCPSQGQPHAGTMTTRYR